MRRERVAICTASCPDSYATGYPGAYQWFDEKRQEWRWLFVGAGSCAATPTQVQRQADSTRELKIGTRVRYVFVEHWIHAYVHGRRGWKAVLDPERTVEVKKQKNVKRRCCSGRLKW